MEYKPELNNQYLLGSLTRHIQSPDFAVKPGYISDWQGRLETINNLLRFGCHKKDFITSDAFLIILPRMVSREGKYLLF